VGISDSITDIIAMDSALTLAWAWLLDMGFYLWWKKNKT
jgi:hypothetical protein